MSDIVKSSRVSACQLVFKQGRAAVDVRVQLDWECVSGSLMGTCGQVCVSVVYTDPEAPLRARASHCYREKIFHTQGVGLVLHIIDFKLPSALMQCGIGTLIWSRIYRVLDDAGLLPMQLTGSLSGKDATVCHVNADGLQVWQDIEGRSELGTIPNTERRNAFWNRMLDTTNRRFDCDAAGRGGFSGCFIDPAAHRSYQPAFTVVELGGVEPGGIS